MRVWGGERRAWNDPRIVEGLRSTSAYQIKLFGKDDPPLENLNGNDREILPWVLHLLSTRGIISFNKNSIELGLLLRHIPAVVEAYSY